MLYLTVPPLPQVLRCPIFTPFDYTLHESSATAQTFLELLSEFILCLLSSPLREGRMLVLSSKYIEQADFTDWIYFQSPSLIEEISPHSKSPEHKYLKTNQHEIADKTKKY